MLAASAQVTSAIPASGSDGAAAPANAVDGFTAALAALMAILGQLSPTDLPADAAPDSPASFTLATAGAPTTAAQNLAPGPTPATASAGAPANGDGPPVASGPQTETAAATSLSLPAFAGPSLSPTLLDSALAPVSDTASGGGSVGAPAAPPALASLAPDAAAPASPTAAGNSASPTATTPAVNADAPATPPAELVVNLQVAVQSAEAQKTVGAPPSAPPPAAVNGDATAAAPALPSPSRPPTSPAVTAPAAVAESAIDPRLLPFTARADPPATTSAFGAQTIPASTPAPAPPTGAVPAPPANPAINAATGAQPDDAQLTAAVTAVGAAQPRPPETPLGASQGQSKPARGSAQSEGVGAIAGAVSVEPSPADVVKVDPLPTAPNHPAALAGVADDADADQPPATDSQAQAPPPPAPNPSAVGPTTPSTPPPVAPPGPAEGLLHAATLAQAHGAEITAQLAAQIAQRPTRTAFDFALEPQGLGRVYVSLKFDPQGQVSAVLSFDNPSAAAEARGRASDLHQALQQAGLDVSQGGLSFTSGGQGHGTAWRSSTPANTIQSPAADAAPAPSAGSSPKNTAASGGLDILI